MPLSDFFPRIDNRTFDDLVEEARARVPRYTAELTDFNPGDPAFALIELNAWMTDLLLYRLGRVSELHYLKFLALIGIDLAPARPASAIITLPVLRTFSGQSVVVPARTALATTTPDEAGPIIFETARAFTAINATLAGIIVSDGYSFFDRNAANGGSSGFAPFGELANAGSSLMLGLDSLQPLPGDAELSIGIVTSEPKAGGITLSGTPDYLPATITYEAWTGLSWVPLTLLSDDTAAMTRTGIVKLRLPKAGLMPRATFGAVLTPLYYLRAHVVASQYETAPRLESVALNCVLAEQAETIEYEILGGSDGSPDQIFRLANTPVLVQSLILEVDEGDEAGFTPWVEVEDFYGVAPLAKVYVLDRATGEVRFGAERAPVGGRIPAANRLLPRANIRARRYRYGGGTRGNLPLGAISVLMNSQPGLDAAGVRNILPGSGGLDEETLPEIIERAPRSLKARDRAVSAEDFETFALQAGPVRRAKAFPLHHPQFPGIEVPGVVSVVIVPQSEASAPYPAPALRRAVCDSLERYRLIGTELYVIGPGYARLALSVRAVAAPEAAPAELRLAVEAAARGFFHPFTGGLRGTGWPFGGPIHYGELYQAMAVPGVQRFDDIILTLNGIEVEPCKSATIGATELIDLVEISVEVSEASNEGGAP